MPPEPWPPEHAGIAQLVEQLICNQKVGGSSPSVGARKLYTNKHLLSDPWR